MSRSISELKAGAVARIVRYTHDNEFTHRLHEMGLIPGTLFTYVRRAPMSGPIEISFGQSRLALRLTDNVDIHVEQID